MNKPILGEAYEIIAATISEFGKRGALIDRDRLAEALLSSNLKTRIEERSNLNGRDRGKPFEIAANYVDWFSANLTEGLDRVAKWSGSLIRARVYSSHPETSKLREIWAYSVRDDNIRGQLLFKVDPCGRIAVGVVGRDGDWTFADNSSRLPSGLYTVTFGRWAAILGELEELINDPGCTELQLQRFFESYPELLKGEEYAQVIPEAVIHRADQQETIATNIWEADFVLAPVDQNEFCRILELKRPQIGSVRGSQRGHARFYKELHEAIQQLHDYHNAFYSPRTQELFRGRYGVDVYRPDLQLIIGRNWDTNERSKIMDLQRTNYVTIRSWDRELERLRRKFH